MYFSFFNIAFIQNYIHTQNFEYHYNLLIYLHFILDGNDLITCMIIAENGAKTRRYLSIISSQLVLVEPHSRFLGWGVCKLSCYLHDAEVLYIS